MTVERSWREFGLYLLSVIRAETGSGVGFDDTMWAIGRRGDRPPEVGWTVERRGGSWYGQVHLTSVSWSTGVIDLQKEMGPFATQHNALRAVTNRLLCTLLIVDIELERRDEQGPGQSSADAGRDV